MDIRQAIESSIEPESFPEIVRAYVELHEDKLITKRHEERLQELVKDSTLRIRRQYGRTIVEVGPYNSPQTIYLAKTEKNAHFSLAYTLSMNPAFYAAREDRNAKRRKALDDPQFIERLQSNLNEILELQAKVKALRKTVLADADEAEIRYQVREAIDQAGK